MTFWGYSSREEAEKCWGDRLSFGKNEEVILNNGVGYTRLVIGDDVVAFPFYADGEGELNKLQAKTFLLTDDCMWEKNKQEGTRAPHAICVVDIDTGQMQYIRSGSHIKFVAGEISPIKDQDAYNQLPANPSDYEQM